MKTVWPVLILFIQHYHWKGLLGNQTQVFLQHALALKLPVTVAADNIFKFLKNKF